MLMIYYVIAVAGFLIGSLAGLFGIGGGFLMVPLLTLMGLPIHAAIGTSLACIVIGSLASSYGHLRKKRILFRVSALKELFSVPFAVIGAYMTILFTTPQLAALFSVLLVYVAYRMTKRNKPAENIRKFRIRYSGIPLVGAVSGFTSGLLGIGGGIMNVPLFYALADMRCITL